MRGISGTRQIVIVIVVAIVVGIVFWLSVNRQSSVDTDAASSASSAQMLERGQRHAKKAATTVNMKQDGKKAEAEREQAIKNRLEMASKNIQRLNDFLDQDNQSEALKFAKQLLKEGIQAERMAALEALKWLGGREAVSAILPMFASQEDYSDNVDDALRQLIEESLYTNERVMDQEDWLKTLHAAGNENSMYSYMTLLTAFPELDSVPVLLEMYNSERQVERKLAQDFMEFISNGQDLTDYAKAKAWWQKWLDDRGITEQDLQDYANADKVDGIINKPVPEKKPAEKDSKQEQKEQDQKVQKQN